MIVSKRKAKALTDFAENVYLFLSNIKEKKYDAESIVEINEHVDNLIENASETIEEIRTNLDLNRVKSSLTNILKSLKGIKTGYSRDLITYADLVRIVKSSIFPEVKNLSALLRQIQVSGEKPTHKENKLNEQGTLQQALERELKKYHTAEIEKQVKLKDYREEENKRIKNLLDRYSRKIPHTMQGKNVILVELPVIPNFKSWKLNKVKPAERAGIKYAKWLTGEVTTEMKTDYNGSSRLTGDYVMILLNQKILCYNPKNLSYSIDEFIESINQNTDDKFARVLYKEIRSPKNGNIKMVWIMEEKTLSKFAQGYSRDGDWSLPWSFIPEL